MFIEPNSPVRATFRWIESFLISDPCPDLKTDASRSAAILIATHLLHTLQAAGNLNVSGFHSAAVVLFRPLEDALDCFAAVLLVESAAEQWRAGKLRASDAAKQWTALELGVKAQGVDLPEYRKRLRKQFNDLTHCSFELCSWNLHLELSNVRSINGPGLGRLRYNPTASVIDTNAHGIDAHLTAHLLEFVAILNRGYSGQLATRQTELREIGHLLGAIHDVMQEHDEHQCQQTSPPPELRRIKSTES